MLKEKTGAEVAEGFLVQGSGMGPAMVLPVPTGS